MSPPPWASWPLGSQSAFALKVGAKQFLPTEVEHPAKALRPAGLLNLVVFHVDGTNSNGWLPQLLKSHAELF
jgi:hypothetical protein